MAASNLASIHRPSTALIKLVEVLGILIGAPTKALKSRFRVPLPSNYAETILMLENNYEGIFDFVEALNPSDLSNELSQQLYIKSEEPGFNYKHALYDVGQELTPLFNAVIRVLEGIPANNDGRIRVQGVNMIIAMTGNKSSYAALDVGMHLLGCGVCTISIYVDESFLGLKSEQTMKYLCRDVERRCSEQYKITEKLQIEKTIAQHGEDIRAKVEDDLLSARAVGEEDVLCVGLEDTNVGLNGASPLIMWAVWDAPADVILARTTTAMCPFSSLQMSRTVLIHYQLPSPNQFSALDMVEQSLKLIRPNDFLILVISGEQRISRGDNQQTRFDYGNRFHSATSIMPSPPSYRYHSDDKALEECAELYQQFLTHSKSEGIVRVIRDMPSITLSQQLCSIACEEHADFMVIKRYKNEINRNLIVDCAKDGPCSVVILK